MRSHRRFTRALRSLLVPGLACAALAAPAAASAMPIGYYPPHGKPAIAAAEYTLPSGFRSDAATPAPAYKLPSGFKSDAASSGSQTTSTQSPSVVVREVRDNTHTLALVLASAALGIALCGTAFATIRLMRIQRRVLGNS